MKLVRLYLSPTITFKWSAPNSNSNTLFIVILKFSAILDKIALKTDTIS